MRSLYLTTFLIGLLIGVYAMIRGVERVGSGSGTPEFDALGRPMGPSRMAFTAPVAAAFTTLFGITGYLLWRVGASTGVQIAVTLSVAVLGAFAATRAVAHWATQAALYDAPDERYLLQGHPARVVSPIASGQAGEIVYLVGGTQYAATAHSVDGASVAADTEVIIDRVENGTAYVEPWAQVEQRI